LLLWEVGREGNLLLNLIQDRTKIFVTRLAEDSSDICSPKSSASATLSGDLHKSARTTYDVFARC
jgi:hypothetical protein